MSPQGVVGQVTVQVGEVSQERLGRWRQIPIQAAYARSVAIGPRWAARSPAKTEPALPAKRSDSATSRARLLPNRCTSLPGVTPASPAMSARVSSCGPRRLMARWAAANTSSSVTFWRRPDIGRLTIAKLAFSLLLNISLAEETRCGK
jgi:hypothetical protein